MTEELLNLEKFELVNLIESKNNQIKKLTDENSELNDYLEKIEKRFEVVRLENNLMKEEIKKAILELLKVGFLNGANSKERALEILQNLLRGNKNE